MARKAFPVSLPFVSVNRASATPMRRQLYQSLRDAIEKEVLSPGSRLPSASVLAGHLGVARRTILIAYERLIVEGYARSASGSGTYVAARVSANAPKRPAIRLSKRALRRPLHRGRWSCAAHPFAASAVAVEEFPWQAWLRLVGSAWRKPVRDLYRRDEGQGLQELRAAIASHVAVVMGISCTPSEVIIAGTSEPPIGAMARLISDRDDHVLIDGGHDAWVRSMLAAAGLHCVDGSIDDEGLDIQEYNAAVPALAYCRPSAQGPAGVVMTPGRRYAFMAWAKKHGTAVIEDDFDAVVDPKSTRAPSLKSIDSKGLVVFVGAFAKTLMPGVAISFAIAPEPLAQMYGRMRPMWANPASAVEQAALTEFIVSGRFVRLLNTMRSVYAERRQALTVELTRQLGGAIVAVRQRAALQLVVRLEPSLSDVAVADAAMAFGLDVLPLSMYASPGEEQGLILGYGGMAAARMSEAVSLLAQSIERARSMPV